MCFARTAVNYDIVGYVLDASEALELAQKSVLKDLSGSVGAIV